MQPRPGLGPERASDGLHSSRGSRAIGSYRGPKTSWSASPFLPEPDPAPGVLPGTPVSAGAQGMGLAGLIPT